MTGGRPLYDNGRIIPAGQRINNMAGGDGFKMDPSCLAAIRSYMLQYLKGISQIMHTPASIIEAGVPRIWKHAGRRLVSSNQVQCFDSKHPAAWLVIPCR